MQIFDEIKACGVEDIFFIPMDGVSRLEAGAKAIFPNVVVQRCTVHLIRNSIMSNSCLIMERRSERLCILSTQ